jgi:hypothetical protein
MTLADLAARVVAFLETLPRDRRVCEDCTATYLNADRHDVLNAFREMVGARRCFVGSGGVTSATPTAWSRDYGWSPGNSSPEAVLVR